MGNKEKHHRMESDAAAEHPDTAEITTEKTEKTSNTDTSGDEIAALTDQLIEQKDKYIRLLAEFENYKKRVTREKSDWLQIASKDTMTALLPVLDDFDRARKNAESNDQEFPEGIQLIYHKLYATLHARGLKPMDSSGKEFDPEWHEAITEIPVQDDALRGKVIDTVETGYLLNDRIIRYAKVVVGK